MEPQAAAIAEFFQSSESAKGNWKFINWVDLYDQNWVIAFQECLEWVEQLIGCIPHKRLYTSAGIEGYKAYTANILAGLSPPELSQL